MNNVKLSDAHLKVINNALEAYFRMKTGQISIALDVLYGHSPKSLSYDESKCIESVVRTIAMPHIDPGISGYGFNSEKIGDARIAYEIKKTFEEYLSVKNNDGYYGNTCNFDGPLKASEEPLPIVEEHKNYKDFPLTKTQSKKVNDFIKQKSFDKLWLYIDSLKIPKGGKSEVVQTGAGTIVRVTRARKNEGD